MDNTQELLSSKWLYLRWKHVERKFLKWRRVGDGEFTPLFRTTEKTRWILWSRYDTAADRGRAVAVIRNGLEGVELVRAEPRLIRLDDDQEQVLIYPEPRSE